MSKLIVLNQRLTVYYCDLTDLIHTIEIKFPDSEYLKDLRLRRQKLNSLIDALVSFNLSQWNKKATKLNDTITKANKNIKKIIQSIEDDVNLTENIVKGLRYLDIIIELGAAVMK